MARIHFDRGDKQIAVDIHQDCVREMDAWILDGHHCRVTLLIVTNCEMCSCLGLCTALGGLACSGFVRMFACLPMYTTINMNCWHTVIVCVDTLLIILVEYRTDEQILHSGQATNPRTDPTKGKNSLAPCQQFGPFSSCQSICRVFCFGTSKLIDASGTGMRRNRIFLC